MVCSGYTQSTINQIESFSEYFVYLRLQYCCQCNLQFYCQVLCVFQTEMSQWKCIKISATKMHDVKSGLDKDISKCICITDTYQAVVKFTKSASLK